MNEDQIREYFSWIKKLRQRLPLGHQNFNQYWLEVVPEGGPNWDLDVLPKLLALVHPDFTMDRNGQPVRNGGYASRTFKAKYSDERCSVGTLFEGIIQCPYHRETTRCEADHLWPFSLGGPTDNTNKLPLCKDCNQQKSNSPFLYPANMIPRWLRLRIQDLINKKRDII